MRDALKERFNPLNTLTTENREAEWKSLTPEHKMPMSDYVDDFLFHTALYENALATPLTDEAKKRRLMQSLSGRDEALLVNLAMNLQTANNNDSNPPHLHALMCSSTAHRA